MKRILIVIALITLAAVAGFYYFSEREIPFMKDTSMYKAVPVSVPLFFELNSIKGIPVKNDIVQLMNESRIGSKWFEFLTKADSLIETNENIPGNFKNKSFLLAYGIAGRNELVPFIITNAGSESRQNALKQFIEGIFPVGIYKYSERDYGKYRITEVSDAKGRDALIFSFTPDLLLASPRAIIIEQSLRQLSSNGINHNQYFLEVNKNTGSQPVSLFVNHNWINTFFSGFLNRASFEKADEFGAVTRFQFTSETEKFSSFASWSEYAINFNGKQMVLNGSSAADDSLNHFLAVFKGQQPARSRAANYLPQNTSFYCSYTFSSKNQFFEQLENFYTHSPAYYHREERMKRFDRGLRVNFRNILQSAVKDEVIVAVSAIPVNTADKTTFFIIQTENRSDAEKQFYQLMVNFASRINTDVQELYEDFDPNGENRYRIYKFPYPSFPGLWLGTPFNIAEARFAVFYENLLLFSNSETGIKEYLRSRINGNTLAGSSRYQRFSNSVSGKALITAFADVNRIFSLRDEIFATPFVKQINEREETIRRIGFAGFQIQFSKGIFENTVLLDLQSDTGEDSQTTWDSDIGSNVAVKPFLVANHLNRAAREIILQDENNNIHLVNHLGQVRWSAPVSGKITGEIIQVDLYKNGKLQFLFSTKEKLYVIDRNGNNVTNFPVGFKSPATSGVAVFDYDNNRNYRFFVACEDRNFYVFDNTGKSISGWSFGKTETDVTIPARHFKAKGKDYIVFNDKSRVYILDRQGNTRIEVNQDFKLSNNPVDFYDAGEPKFVFSEKDGKVYYIFLDGKIEEKRFGKYSSNHFFTVDDVDGNGILDFIFADGNEITVTDEKGKKLFSRKMNNPIKQRPDIYTFPDNQKKIGIVDEVSNRIYLYNPDGRLYTGFPLQGNSRFSIGKLSESSENLNLITGGDGGKLYNYTLN